MRRIAVMLMKDQAVCIRKADYSETSQIVTLLARQAGKINAIAKGSKRPRSAFDGAIDIFSYGDIVFTEPKGAGLAKLVEFQQRNFFKLGRNRLFALNCSRFAAELLNSLVEDCNPHPQLFDSFIEFLQNIQNAQDKPGSLVLLILFQLTLLKDLGLQPVLNACINCKSQYTIRNKFTLSEASRPEFIEGSGVEGQYEAYFSSSAAGLVCKDCEGSFSEKIRLSKAAAGCLTDLKLLAKAAGKTLNEVEKLLVYYFTELLGRRPKMAKYILKS